MDLKKKMAEKKTTTLVEMLETIGGYTSEAIEIMDAELRSRNIPMKELKKLASDFIKNKAKDQMNHLDPLNDELIISESYFLSKTEVKNIYIEEFATFMKEKEGFRFDVWKYAIGGI